LNGSFVDFYNKENNEVLKDDIFINFFASIAQVVNIKNYLEK